MLEIIVNNKTRLQLPVNINLQITLENPLFQDDSIPSPYSLSFAIPATPGNVSALGYPTRITSTSVISKQPAEIRHSGMIISRGEVLLLETGNSLKLQFVGSILTDEMKSDLNEISDIYDYGFMPEDLSDIDYYDNWAVDYKDALNYNLNHGRDYVIAPVRIKDVPWDGDISWGGTKNSFLQYINFYNPINNKLYIGDGHYRRTPVLPFPFVHKLISKVFGDKLPVNPFAVGDLAKLVTVSCNHPHWNYDSLFGSFTQSEFPYEDVEVVRPLIDSYEAVSGQIPLKFDTKSFSQAYAFNKFLKELLKTFSMSAFPGNVWTIEKNNDIFNGSVVVNWDEKLVGIPVKKIEEGKSYVFSFDGISLSENKTNYGFRFVNPLYLRAITKPVGEQVLLRDLESNAQFGTTVTHNWSETEKWLDCEVKQSALECAIPDSTENLVNPKSEVIPLDMSIEPYWNEEESNTSHITRKYWYVPILEKKELTKAPNIMAFAGMAGAFDENDNYPLLLNHNTDHFGNKLMDLSLRPEGQDGLNNTFHSGMKSWYEKDKLRLQSVFRLTLSDIRNLDLRKKIYLKGRLFFIEKLEYSLTMKDISLVDASLVEC
jgi:hypothetical protein